ncbi:MAG: carboxypeptidase-like regulatory domain-containing protein [Myxococcota bacterium]
MGHSMLRLVPLLGLLLLGCGEDPVTEARNVSGFVTELGSGDPIRGATVTFTSNTLLTNSTRTNGSGFYEMVVETDSEVGQLRAEVEGFDPAEETVFFDTDDRRVDIELKSGVGDDG